MSDMVGLLVQAAAFGAIGASVGETEVFGKMVQRGQHREGRHAAHRAQRAGHHRVAQIAQQLHLLSCTCRRCGCVSITSTPRVEPIRHGVHLPQDSIAQNSIAYRASSAMFDRVVVHDDAAVADHARRPPRYAS